MQQPEEKAQPEQGEDGKSLGKEFYNKLEANQLGIGPAFAERVLGEDEGLVDSLRKRAGTASEGIKATFSRISTAAIETAQSLGLVTEHEGLARAAEGLRVKDIAVPGAELIYIDANQKVGELEAVLRREHIHSVPVWNAPAKRFEGVVDVLDLVTWAVVKFSKQQLDAWATFRQESEFAQQPVQHVVDASWRNQFFTTTADAELLSLLEHFRDRDIHRVFIRRPESTPEKDLIGVVTQTDLLRFLHQAKIESKAAKVGEKIRSHSVVTCFEEELVISAFRLMDNTEISAVGVVDATGKLVGVISSFDIVSGAQESVISFMFKPLRAFLGREQPNAQDKLQIVRVQNTIGEVIEKMVNAKVLHAFVVDDDGYPTASITLRELLAALK